MRTLIQFTQAVPQDWEEHDHTEWQALPNLPIHAINVQGVVFEGYDHYVIGDTEGGCTVTVWNDRDAFEPPMRWTFLPLFRDPRFGGRLNTQQWVDVYGDHPLVGAAATGGAVRAHPRGDFIAGAGARHGVQVPDALHAAHQLSRTVRGWKEWS